MRGFAGPGGALVLALLVLPGRALGADRSLDGEVRRLVAAFLESGPGLGGAKVAVAVLSDRGEAVVSLLAREPVKPASNLKVLTTAAALHHLGLNHQFETTITGTAPIQNGTIAGALVVRGTGDPNISARFHGGDPEALFARWARRLQALGLRRVEGDLIADDTFFDGVRFPVAWDRRQEEAWYAAQVSALSLNDNCLDIAVRPAARPGLPARVEASPLSAAIDFAASVRTVTEGQPHIVLRRKPGTNRITVEGTIRAGSAPWSGNITIDDPALFFAHSLARVFAREGIAIAGQVRKLPRAAGEESGADGDVPGGGTPRAAGETSVAAGGTPGAVVRGIPEGYPRR